MGKGFTRLELDQFRVALHGSKNRYWRLYEKDPSIGGQLQDVFMGALRAALQRPGDLVLSNTHLLPEFVDPVVEVLQKYPPLMPRFVVFSSVSLNELIRRNDLSNGEDRVPPDIIGRDYARLHAPDAWWRAVAAKYPQMVAIR